MKDVGEYIRLRVSGVHEVRLGLKNAVETAEFLFLTVHVAWAWEFVVGHGIR